MTLVPSLRVPARTLLAIALVSASLLAFQVLLTRVCALRLHFHFGFLIISNSLLGIGASGSLLALVEAKWRRDPAAWTWGFLVGYLVSLGLSWAYLLTAQIPATLTFTTAQETLQFALFNLACAVPFCFGGTAIGLILSANAERVHSVYAADLLGAGAGCLLCPALLWYVGAGGCFLAVVLLGVMAALAMAPPERLQHTRWSRGVGIGSRVALAVLAIGACVWLPRFDRDFPVPGKVYLDITREQTIREFGRPVFSQWSANSRIDVMRLPGNWRYLQTRGAVAKQMPLPLQWWIAQDGDAGTLLTDFGSDPASAELLKHTMYSASFQLKQGTRPKVFVIGVGGGPDLWAAKQYDASLIRGIELNQAVLDVHRTVAKDFSKPLLDDPRVQMICDEGRTSLMRTDESFDVVQLTGIDTWTALNSGAYVLAENYLYTVEACRTMYGRLNDGGILQITRMAAGMETIRLMNNMYHALPLPARERFRESVAALGTDDGLIAVLLKKGVFTPAEVDQLTSFAEQNQIDKVVLPGKQLGTAAEEFVVSPDRDAFVAHYKFDISPTTDDRPYFFSFLRWDNPLSFLFASKSTVAREYLHKPTSMVQGNPMFLWLQLLCSAIAAALFIVVPLLFRRGAANRSRQGALPLFCYFAGLGIGFIGIEVALIQKFTLLLGQPIYSIVVTLFSILVATGIGSWLSSKVLRQGPRVARFVPLGICALLGLIAFGSQHLVDACIGLPLPARAAVTALVIAPLALLLGMPFAYGITLVQKVNPSFVPWAWAVNGSTTVIGSIATVILSMNFGFAAVLLLCGVVYLLAFAAVDRLAIRVLAE